MTRFPQSPKLRKAAIVSIALPDPRPNVIGFQYNPDSLTRRLEPRSARSGSGDRVETLRLAGPPRETLSVSVEVDAIDAYYQEPPNRNPNGVFPTLSALELLLYPSSAVLVANAALAASGILEVAAPEAPLSLFVWGPQRVLPVRLTGMNVTEEAFDPDLNPLRARADLTFDALSSQDLRVNHPAYNLFIAYQIAKEALALGNPLTSISALGVSLSSLGGAG
jgi:hypothetical protein